jgi:aspartyl-tRNA(Asn)/glutamyl-tRNA(Gln) amidotransferase subunit B
MEEGNFRCDANISLRPAGATELGAKVEVKNMNSFRAVYNALRFEVERQTRALDGNERIPQETRGWVEHDAVTVSQRSKEEAHDYRYFPEPDLPPVTLTQALIEEIRVRLPELPDAKLHRFEDEYGLSRYEASLLTETQSRAAYYERTLSAAGKTSDDRRRRVAKKAANWILGDFARLLNAANLDIDDARVSPDDLYAMIALIEDGTITGNAAKAVFEEMFETGKSPARVVGDLGLEQMSGQDEIAAIVERVIEANPKPVEDYRAGKQEAIKYLVGRAMQETRGRANPATLTEILKAKLEA